ncbi:MAG: EamA family transporter RarD [Dysosmobacter welbionis]
MKNKGSLYVLTCYVIWGLLPIFWKLLAQVDSLYVLASRIVWSMVLTGGILLLRRDRLAGVRAAFRDRREWGLLAAAGCVVCVNWGVYIWAVANGHMIDSSLAYYMNPILAILLGTVLFRERLTKLQWLAVAVTFAGLVITVIRYRQIPWIALVIGGSFAVYGALKKQVRSDAAVSTFVETLTLAPFALVLIFWMEAHGTGAAGVLSGWQWLLLPVSGVVTTVPLMFFAAGMKTTPMTLSGILMYINPTMQLLLSVALYGEAFTATHAILFGFVWTGLILYLISGARESRMHREEETPCV